MIMWHSPVQSTSKGMGDNQRVKAIVGLDYKGSLRCKHNSVNKKWADLDKIYQSINYISKEKNKCLVEARELSHPIIT